MSYVRLSDLGVYVEGKQDPYNESGPSIVDEHGEENAGSEYLEPFAQMKQPAATRDMERAPIQVVVGLGDAAPATVARASSICWPAVAAGVFGVAVAALWWRSRTA